MTKSENAYAGSTLLGPDVAKLPEQDGVSFEEWLVAAAKSRDGVTRLEIQARAGQGPRAWRDYAKAVAEARGLALTVQGGNANNNPGGRVRARFFFEAPEVADKRGEIFNP